MRNKQRLLIMFLLIVMLFLYIVNNGHGLLYNHVIALEDEISFVAALVVLILSIPKAVDTFAKQSKIVKSISFISKVLALLIILMIPYLKDFVLLKKLMSVLDTNILLILILFFAYAGQVRIISKSSSHKGEYGIVTGTTKNREWLKVRLSNSTIKVAFSSVMQIN